MHLPRFSRAALACVTGLTLAACGGDDAADDVAEDADPSAEAPADPGGSVQSEAPPSTAAPITVEDIDRWQKGMAGELAAVREAAASMKSAKTATDTMSAMMAVQETGTQEAGAKAAGLDLERYKTVRSDLSAVASYLTPELGGIDTTMLSPEQRAEMRQMNEAQLKQMEDRVPPDVIAALRPRAAELRKQSMELVGARLKGAGI